MISRWVRHNEHLRLEYFEELLCSIDLFRMPRDVLSTVILQHPLVLQSEKCQVRHDELSVVVVDRFVTHTVCNPFDVLCIASLRGCLHLSSVFLPILALITLLLWPPSPMLSLHLVCHCFCHAQLNPVCHSDDV